MSDKAIFLDLDTFNKMLHRTTLRDQLAMAALTGILANPKGPAGDWDKVSNDSYEAADAMLKAREE